ncbi:DUF1996 domain-containing protein [Streptomyces sp. NBC_00390]|uniref:DUF1996 domain-containing protein n=1 Tax=Streptomyces sp. NBC_00390 TaxID=2975736 RepID=UPI002E1CC991
MRHTVRRRSRRGRRLVVASVALVLGGGGLVAITSYASAGEGWGSWGGKADEQQQTQSAGLSASTIKCPEVANGLPDVPEAARAEVDRELATMDSQITEAYQRFADEKEQIEQDPQFVQNAILGPLQDKRAASIDRIAVAIGRAAGQRPQGLEALAPCALQADEADNANGGQDQGDGQDQGQDQDQGQGQGDGQDQGQGQGQAGNGPEAGDFVDIESVQPNVQNPRKLRNASRGTFSTKCGVNANGKFNPDNVIVAPGVSNGAHHMHDYVGNQANDAFASDDDLAGGQTTCNNQGDKSTYYWPVLRLQNGQNENDAEADGGGKDQNVGEIQTPSQVTLNFVGSPVGKVTAMPRFLRIITGDAKAFVNGNANANASWSCTGFENRQLKDKYPICPEGSQVVRSFKFQSCWDGQNIDSANHRTHVAFADQNGNCPNGFQAIPQLVQRIVYDVPPPVFDGENASVFAVDSFPEQLHKPVTDHGDFINVFDDNLMKELVDCINTGRQCGSDDPGDPQTGPEEGPDAGDGSDAESPAESPAVKDDKPSSPGPVEGPGAGKPAVKDVKPSAAAPQESSDAGAPAVKDVKPSAPVPTKTPAAVAEADAGAPAVKDVKPSTAGPEDSSDAAAETGQSAPTAQGAPDAGANGPASPVAGEPQGGLADTGAVLWPSAAALVLLTAGFLLLRARTRRRTVRHR